MKPNIGSKANIRIFGAFDYSVGGMTYLELLKQGKLFKNPLLEPNAVEQTDFARA